MQEFQYKPHESLEKAYVHTRLIIMIEKSQKHKLSTFSMGFWTRNLCDGCRMLCYFNLHNPLSKCVPIVGMHQIEHGGRICGHFRAQ